jgi:predicted transcriptional regulator
MMSDNFNLTPVELELMDILWKIGNGTVRDVMAMLPSNRALAYTSVSTILRILQEKKILLVEKIGRQHIYHPTLSQQTFASFSVKKIVNQVFSGSSMELVSYLMNKNDLSIEEITKIQNLLDAKKKELAS